jgi:hypothetical protein
LGGQLSEGPSAEVGELVELAGGLFEATLQFGWAASRFPDS